jgi:hypothetical protein
MAQPCGWSFRGCIAEPRRNPFAAFQESNTQLVRFLRLHLSGSQLPCTSRMISIHPGRVFAFVLVGVLFLPVATKAQESAPAVEETPRLEKPADSPSKAQSSTTSPTPIPSAAPAPSQSDQPAGLDFQFFEPDAGASAGADSAAKSADLSEQSRKRRHRLETHQFLGLTTWAFMAASCIIGQLNYNDLYGGGSGRGSYMLPHQLLVYSTTGLFTATGIYALLAPQPYNKPLKFDTGLVHRIAAIGATAGMVAQVVLGFITARTADAGNPSGLHEMAKIHDVVGWTTFGFMTAAGAAWIF